MSNNSTQRQAKRIDSNQHSLNEQNQASAHYVEDRNYPCPNSPEQSELTQFNGIRVVDESGPGKSKKFENFRDLYDSSWTISGKSGARLGDGTIQYEGHHE